MKKTTITLKIFEKDKEVIAEEAFVQRRSLTSFMIESALLRVENKYSNKKKNDTTSN